MDNLEPKIDRETEEKLEDNPPKALVQYWGFIVLIIMLLFCALGIKAAYSEGSKELSSNGGNRIITSMEGDARVTISSVDGMTTEVYAYAEEGEVLNMASSKNVDGWGYIEYFSPNGNSYRCFIPATTDTTKVGFIASATEEFAGAGAIGGFTPCEHTVLTGETGVWKVEFISTIGSTVSPYQNEGRQLDANEEWQVTPGGPDAPVGQGIDGQDIRWGEVIAWDVSVSDASLSTTGTIIPGRAFVTQYAGVADFLCEKNNTVPCDISIEGSGGIANHRFFVQTIDGELFDLLTNSPTASNGLGYAPFTHVLFANNKGITDLAGNQTLQSISQAALSGGSFTYQRPGLAETQTCPDCYGHKMFFSKPASDIPMDINHAVAVRTNERENITNANIEISGTDRNDLGTFPIVSASGVTADTTWLVNTIEVPEFTNIKLVGIEGTDNRVGEGMGGFVSFTCTPFGTAPNSVCDDIGPGGTIVNIELDLTNDGVVDVIIPNVDISVGVNLIAWDGTVDNNGGTVVPAGEYPSSVTIIQGDFGRVHFPTIDGEFNSNGWSVGRINGPNASEISPDYTIFWDDTTIGGDQSPVGGADSSNGEHDWLFAVGNVNVVDTYALVTFGEFTSAFEIINADLQVESVTTNVGAANQTSGNTVEFTITYVNAGPSAVDSPTLLFDADSTYFTNVQFVASSCTETILPGNTSLPTQTACGSDGNGSVVGDTYSRTGTYINPGDKITFKVTADVKADGDLPLTPGQIVSSTGNIGSILRPADVFDANATNPDVAVPTSVQAECETNTTLDPGTDYPGGATSFGTDCNNALAGAVNVQRAQTVLGIAKDAAITYNNDDTYTVAFTFNVLNQSEIDVFDVQIEDDLVAPLGTYNATATVNSDLAVGEYYVTVPVAVDSITDINTLGNTTLTANTSYNGSADKNLLTVSNPTSSSLGVGDSAALSVTVVTRPDFSNGSITYENQAELQVDASEDFNVDKQFTKLSNDGVTPDTENNSVTPVPLPKIGLAKSVDSFDDVASIPGAFDVTLKFIIRNVGNVNLQSIGLTDDFTGVFGTYLSSGEVANPGEYRILTAPSATTDAGSTITVNTGFNGDSDQNIISPLVSDLLEIGDTSEITLTVRFFVDVNNNSITYLNNALVTAEDADGTSVSARSANGVDPTLSPPPNDPEDPTPIPYYLIQNDKELLSSIENGDGTYTISYKITTTNFGNSDLFDVQVTDDLAAGDFGTYNATATASGDLATDEYYLSSPVAQNLVNTSGNSSLTLETGYTGTSPNINLLQVINSATEKLAPGDKVEHTITITFKPNFGALTVASYNNETFSYGDFTTNGTSDQDISDVSGNGFNLQGGSTPVPLPIPQIALLKDVVLVDNTDGTFTANYTVKAQNIGNRDLFNVQVYDDLSNIGNHNATATVVGDLALGEYYISTAAAVDIGGLTANTSFNGASDKELLTLNTSDTLLINQEATITFGITLRYDPDASFTYLNQAIGWGYLTDDTGNNTPADPTNPTDTDTFDLSNNDVYFDPNDPNDKEPNDNNDPTPLDIAVIETTNTILSGATDNGDGTYTVVYRLVTTNKGQVDLFDVQVTDDLAAADFGTYNGTATVNGDLSTDEYYLSSAVTQSITNTSGNSALTLNTGYTGTGPNDGLLQVTNNNTEKLVPGDSVTHDITITFKPDFGNLTEMTYDNISVATGDKETNGVVDIDVTDTAGNSFNNIGGGTPTPTPLPKIGLLKDASVVDNGDGTFVVNYTVKAQNIGNRDLFNVQVYDDLSNLGNHNATATTDGDLALGEYYITTPAAVDLGGLTANTSFNGASDKELLTLNTSDTLLINQEATITFGITLRYDPDASFTYLNQAIGWGYLTDDTGNNTPADPTNPTDTDTFDLSNNDVYFDPNDPNDKEPSDNNVPTPADLPVIQITKTVQSGPIDNTDGTYTVVYRLVTENKGTIDLFDLQVTDDLAAADFGTYNATATVPLDLATDEYYLSSPVTQNITNTSGNSALTLNSSYTGTTPNLGVLQVTNNNAQKLAPGDSVTHDITITFKPDFGGLTEMTYSNNATATGDLTTNGVADADVTDSAGNSFNNIDDGDPTDTPLPKVGVLKDVALTNNNDGTYTADYTVKIQNIGNRPLFNVQVYDDLSNIGNHNATATVPGDLALGEYYISTPAAVNILGLMANTSFDGASDKELITLSTTDTLIINQEATITFSVTLRYDEAATFTYLNQAIGWGYLTDDVGNNTPADPTNPTDADTFDLSNDNVYFDPNDPNDQDPSDNNDPTPIDILEVDLTKAVTTPLSESNGVFSVGYTFTATNNASADLFDVQVSDNLTTFGSYTASTPTTPGTYTIENVVLTPSGTTNLALNTGFNGDSDQDFLNVQSGQGYIFKQDENFTITFTVKFMPDFGSLTTNNYDNFGTLKAEFEEDGVANGSMITSNTTVLPVPRIGIAKEVVGFGFETGTSTFLVSYKMHVENYGNRDLFNVYVRDDFADFGTYVAGTPTNAGEYTIASAPLVSNVSSGSSITANSGYNSDTDNDLINGTAPGTNLEIGDSFDITFTVRIAADFNNVYENQAAAYGYLTEDNGNNPDSVTADTEDLSHNGTDPAGNPDPNDTPVNPDDPKEYLTKTPLELPAIQVTKTIQTGPTDNNDTTYTVVYRLVTENKGQGDLFDMQITDDLAAAGFGTYNGTATVNGDLATGEYYLSSAVTQTLTNTSGNSALTLETAYTGTSPNTSLLQVMASATEKLVPGDLVTHDITITFKPDFGSLNVATFNNSAVATGDVESNGIVDEDITDNSGNSFNNIGGGDPTPTPIPQIALLKDVVLVDNTDGTFTANYTVKAQNIGNRDLFNVQVYDDLSNIGNHNATATVVGDLALGEYYISTAAAVDIGGLTANTSFNGASDKELLTLNTSDTLLINQEATITFSVTLRYDDTANFSYLNQAIGWGYLTDDTGNNTPADPTNPTDTDTFDLSNNDVYFDPNDPNDKEPNDNNDPTPLDIAVIETTNTILSGATDNGDGTYTVVYRLVTTNKGQIDLFDVQVTDDLAAADFGTYNGTATVNGDLSTDEYYLSSAVTQSITNTSGNSALTLNTGYTGTGPNDGLLQVTNNNTEKLVPGDSVTHDITITFKPDFGNLTEMTYDNISVATGDKETNGVVDIDVTDTAGNSFNNIGGGTPTPTPLPKIGAAKSATVAVFNNTDDVYETEITVRIENVGNRDLYNVFATDDLTVAFGTYVATVGDVDAISEYTIVEAPTITSISSGSSLTLNSGFNGDSDKNILDFSQAADVLLIGGSAEIKFKIGFLPDFVNNTFENTVNVGGYLTYDADNDPEDVGTPPDTTDASNDQTLTDPNDPNDKDPSDDNTPTPIIVPIVSLALDHENVVNNNDGTFDVTFLLNFENDGNVTLYDLQLVDDITDGFGPYVANPSNLTVGQYSIISTPTITADTVPGGSNLVVNSNFNGDTDEDMFDFAASDAANASLTVGAKVTVEYTVRFFYDGLSGAGLSYETQADITGDSVQNGTIDRDTEDESTDGLIPDINENNHPRDERDVTPVEIPQVAFTKEATSVTLAESGLYEVAYKFRLQNTGNVLLDNIQIVDDLTGTRGFGTYVAGTPTASGQYTIVTPPAVTVTQDNFTPNDTDLTANASFNGSGNQNLLVTSGTSEIGVADVVEVTFTVGVFSPDFEMPSPNLVGENYEVDNSGAIQYSYSGNQEQKDSCLYSGTLDPNCTPEVVTVLIAQDPGVINTTKVANKQVVTFGDIVTWTLESTNADDNIALQFEVRDDLPPGISYIPGSAYVEGVPKEPTINGSQLVWEIDTTVVPGGLEQNEKVTIIFSTIVTPISNTSIITNVAYATFRDEILGQIGRASVRVEDDPLMSCAEIMGYVYTTETSLDALGGAVRRGVSGVELYTETGLRVTADDKGKFHISCIDVVSDIGQNFILKLDERSLPIGYRVKSENPRVIRISKGKVTKIEFDVGVMRNVSITLTDENFVMDSPYLSQESAKYLDTLIEELMKEESTLNITIYTEFGEDELQALRKKQMENIIKQMWKKVARSPYRLEIDVRLLRY